MPTQAKIEVDQAPEMERAELEKITSKWHALMRDAHLDFEFGVITEHGTQYPRVMSREF